MTPEEIARSLIGVKWIHQGRRVDSGIDCVGLLVHVAHELGLPFKDRVDYPRHPDGKSLTAALDEFARRKGESELVEPSDILVFWFTRATRPQHCGIASSIGVIHTHAGAGRVVEHRLDQRWTKRIAAAYEFPGGEKWRR